MQGVIALLLGSAGGLLIWAVLAQRKVSKLRSKYAPINNAEEEAERIRKQSLTLQEQSKKMADSIIVKGQVKRKQLEQEAESPHYQERCHPSYSQTRGLDGAEQCVVTARRSRLMSEGG